MEKPLMRYDVLTDELVPCTQEWIDGAQKALMQFAIMRQEVRKLVNTPFVDAQGAVRD